MLILRYSKGKDNKPMSNTKQLVEAITPKKKKSKRSLKDAFTSVCKFCEDLARFGFFAASIGAGYVLFTQGEVGMKIVGGVLLAGGVVYFADKTIRK